MNKIEQNIIERISNWKKSLLDMTKRNRLLWYKPYRVGSLKFEPEIFDNKVGDILDVINGIAFNSETIEFIVDSDINIEGAEETGLDEKYIEMVKERTKSLLIINKKIKLENEEKGLYVAVNLPDLPFGSVGGGTNLPAQRELRTLVTKGQKDLNASQLVTILAVGVLAAEISGLAALSNHSLASAHQRLAR